MALTDMVIMPGADYQDACNAVREKTGGTAAIKSGEMGAQIRAIDTQENLDAELTAQDDLIAQISAALDGKAAASVETCTVKTTGLYASRSVIWTTVDEAGNSKSTFALGSNAGEITAVCGTSVVFIGSYIGCTSTHGTSTNLHSMAEYLDLTGVPAGTTVEVTLTQD